MALVTRSFINSNADIEVLDSVGGMFDITYVNSVGTPVDISTNTVNFECGSLVIALAANGTGKRLTLSPANMVTLKAEDATRFAVINRTSDPDEILWEGNIFIRTVGA